MENDNTNTYLLQRISELERKVTKFQDLHNSQSRWQHKSSQITAAQRVSELERYVTKLQDLHNPQSRCGFYRQHKSSQITAAQDLLEKFRSKEEEAIDILVQLKRCLQQLDQIKCCSFHHSMFPVVREFLQNLLSMLDTKIYSLHTLVVQLTQHVKELQEDVHFNTQSCCLKFHRQHKSSHSMAAQDLLKRVLCMENSKKDYPLTQTIIRFEQFVTKTQSVVKEMLKDQVEIQEMLEQFVIGQNTGMNEDCVDNTGAKAVVDVPNFEINGDCVDKTGADAVVDVPNCEMNEDCVDNTGADAVVDVPNWELNEEREVKEATLCFRVGGEVRNTNFQGTEVVQWFAIDSNGCISPYIEEPPCDGGRKNTPLAIGPFVFLISDVIVDVDFLSNSKPFRVVYYLDMQNVYEKKATPWKKASSLIGEHAQLCHFFVANNMIYAFGLLNNGETKCLCFFDCNKPDRGWNVETCSSKGDLESLCCESTIEFVTTDGKLGRRARRALFFSKEWLLSYDFDTCEYKFSEVFPFNEIRSSHYFDRGVFYLLIRDLEDRFSLVAYNHHDRERGYTQVFGLDDYLPEEDTGHSKLRLVHLGNERLCLVWPLELGVNIKVLCTKFIVEVLYGEYHATNVFSQVHTVEGFSLDNFEAVVVSSNGMILEKAEDNALGLGARLGKFTLGAKSDGQN